MASTKSPTEIWASETFTASSTHADSSIIAVSTDYGGIIGITITNGGTGPTIQLGLQVQWCPESSGSKWYDFGGPFIPSTANSASNDLTIIYNKGVNRIKIIPSQDNTGQDVTVDADISSVSAVV